MYFKIMFKTIHIWIMVLKWGISVLLSLIVDNFYNLKVCICNLLFLILF